MLTHRLRVLLVLMLAAFAVLALAVTAQTASADGVSGADAGEPSEPSYYDVDRPHWQNTNEGWRLHSAGRDYDTGSWIEVWCKPTGHDEWREDDSGDHPMWRLWFEVQCFRGEFSWQGGPLERSTFTGLAWAPSESWSYRK